MEKKSILSALPKNDKQNLKRDCPAPYSVILIKFSKELFLTKCGDFLSKGNQLHYTNPVLNQVISASIKCYQLTTKSANLLMISLKLVMSSYTYLKLLIKSGAKRLFLN